MKRMYRYLLVGGLLLWGCRSKEQEEGLRQRALELDRKEQQLLLREQEVTLKEAELARLEKSRSMPADTARDSTGAYNPNLVGRWSVQMRCTEATCEGSAVGDTKTEQWVIGYDNNRVVARATANNKLVRVYAGAYESNALVLEAEQDSTKMTVRLLPKSPTVLEGQREINRESNCRIVYALTMSKL